MDNYTDAFYEIEFQRMYREQGRVLFRIRNFEKQLNCYINKRAELRNHGIFSATLLNRINLVQARLNKVHTLRDQIEAYKKEISVNNPENSGRAVDAKIIADAYERAYAPAVVVEPAKTGVLDTLCRLMLGRSK